MDEENIQSNSVYMANGALWALMKAWPRGHTQRRTRLLDISPAGLATDAMKPSTSLPRPFGLPIVLSGGKPLHACMHACMGHLEHYQVNWCLL